jgi:hypothetical protein
MNEDQVKSLNIFMDWFSFYGYCGCPYHIGNEIFRKDKKFSPILLIHGVFGSGKSHLLASLVLLLTLFVEAEEFLSNEINFNNNIYVSNSKLLFHNNQKISDDLSCENSQNIEQNLDEFFLNFRSDKYEMQNSNDNEDLSDRDDIINNNVKCLENNECILNKENFENEVLEHFCFSSQFVVSVLLSFPLFISSEFLKNKMLDFFEEYSNFCNENFKRSKNLNSNDLIGTDNKKEEYVFPKILFSAVTNAAVDRVFDILDGYGFSRMER